MGLYRQGYWSGLPFPTSGDFPDPGIEPASPVSPALQTDSLPSESSEKPHKIKLIIKLVFFIVQFYFFYFFLFFNVCVWVWVLFQILFLIGYYRILSSSLCYVIYSRSLLVICFIHNSVYMLIPNS